MPRNRRRLAAVLTPLALVGAAAAIPASASAATAFYGVTADNRLAEFQSDNTSQAGTKAIRGLATGERIVGLDLRPADGRLYGLTNTSRIVVFNPRNAQVTVISGDAFAPALTGDRAAFDFDPTVDRIRVETNAGQNLRIDPTTGKLATVKTTTPADPAAPTTPDPTTPAATTPVITETPGKPDGNLNYAAGDPGAGATPRVTASAYSNAFPIGKTTELFVLDAGRNTLVRQNPENDGTLRTVGGLGTTGEPIAFDIGENNEGYAAIAKTTGSSSIGIYRVNMQTGAAKATTAGNLVGTKQPLVALAAAGQIADDKSGPGLSVSSSSTQLKSRLLEGGVQLTVNADEAVSGEAKVRYGNRTVGTAAVEIKGHAGYDRVVVKLNSTVRNAIRRPQGALIELRVQVADGAGNDSELRRPIRTR
jgi:hypothetical protein